MFMAVFRRGVAAVIVYLAVFVNPVPSLAQSPELTDLSIEPQPLAEALVAIGKAFSITVIASGDLTSDLQAPAIIGELSPSAALAKALEGTALIAQRRSAGTYVVVASKPSASNADTTLAVEEILVYGTKENESIQKISTSVEVFTTERMEDEVLFTIDDILLRTPNVSLSLIGGTNFSIRGVNTRGVGGAGAGSTSQLYIDGSPLNLSQNGVQSVWDLAQVEVLRGPQSTVQGRNALSGAIVAYTADPSYEWTARARLQAATEDVLNASFAFGGPIVDDQLAFRIAYDQQELNTGLKEVSTGLDQQFYDVWTARGKLLIEPDLMDGLRIELIGERSDSSSGDFNFAIAPIPFDDPAFASFDPFGGETHTRVNFSDLVTDRFIADLTYEINDHWSLIGLLTYEETDQLRRLRIGLPAALGIPLDASTASQETSSYEFRAAFDFPRMRGWIGAYAFEQENEGEGGTTAPIAVLGVPVDPPDSLITILTSTQSRVTNEAIFADVTFDLSDRWSLNLGARYDREDFGDNPTAGEVIVEPASCLVFGVIPCEAAAAGIAPNNPATPTDYEAFLPRLGITYDIDENLSTSLTVARGYRAGGILQFLDPLTLVNVINEFDPEFVTNYELAFRSLWLDGQLSLNANLFYTDWEDQQVRIPSALIDSRLSLVENAGESELYGFELSINHQLTKSLSYYVSLGLLHTEFTDFPFSEVPGEFENVAGNAFPTAPEQSLAAGLDYQHSSGIYANVSVNYRSEQYSEVANLAVNEVDAATLVNGRAGYRRQGWNLYVFANNLLDERFATEKGFAVVDTQTGQVSTNQTANQRINFPRIAGLALEYEY